MAKPPYPVFPHRGFFLELLGAYFAGGKRVDGPRLARRGWLDHHGDEIEQLEDTFEESPAHHGWTDRLFERA